MTLTRRMVRSKTAWSFAGLICKALTAWILAAAVQFLLLPTEMRDLSGLEGLQQMSLGLSLALTGGIFALLCLLSLVCYTGKWERRAMVVGVSLLAVLTLMSNFSWAMLVTCLVVVLLFVGFSMWGWDGSPEPTLAADAPQKRRYGILTGILTVLFILFVCAWTVGRIYCFNTPTYDFGIFSQMFHYMLKTGQPLTTLERDGLLSHFAVHVSPIYYLMLPFYALAPYPATLQILQAVVLGSAVIPAWRIARQHGLSCPARMMVCALLLFYPAFSGGTSYDLHENCFLTPLLLWLLYGIDKKSIPLTAVAAVLTLTVKEDAAVYVAVVALWLAVRGLLRKEKWSVCTGLSMLAGAVLWFFGVTAFLSGSGEGVMTYRYKNFYFNGNSSLLTLIEAVFLSPMKAVYECVEPEKLEFIAMTLLPLVGLPLFTRRYERYLLLIPYILVNLMSDYQYQHSIYFQYTYGSTALLFYLTVVNLADLHLSWQRMAALDTAIALSLACFGTTVLPKGISYPRQCIQYQDYYTGIRKMLSEIPADASVSATTFYTVLLSNRDTLYDVRYCEKAHLLETEYIVLNADSTSEYKQYDTDGKKNGFDNLTRFLEDCGYAPYLSYGSNMIVYRRGAEITPVG